MAGRHGRDRAGRRGAADDRRRRAPDHEGRDTGADERRPADAAHDADRERAVDGLFRAHARVLRGLLARRHVVARRAHPQLHDAFARRILVARREPRLFRFDRDRVRRDRVHDTRRHQLRHAFQNLAGAQPRCCARGQRAAVLSGRSCVERRGHHRIPLGERRLSRPADCAALRGVQHGLGRDEHRLCDGRLRASGRFSRRCG